MPTKKIADYPAQTGWAMVHDEKVCRDPDHYPPRQAAWPPGIYEHTCPACGEVHVFTIRPTFFVEIKR